MLKNGNYSAHEIQRMKVESQCQFGIWTDDEQTIELKIYPSVGGAKIKIWAVQNLVAIRRISIFCGLISLPKRTNWQGFDLVTNLERKGNDWYADGHVHMPNNKRRNIAELKISEFNEASLNFFYIDPSDPNEILYPSGTMFLVKKRDGNIDEPLTDFP